MPPPNCLSDGTAFISHDQNILVKLIDVFGLTDPWSRYFTEENNGLKASYLLTAKMISHRPARASQILKIPRPNVL